LNKIRLDIEVISLINSGIYGETYLIKFNSNNPYTKEDLNLQNLHVLKVIDKAKFLKKERTIVMKQIQAMMHAEYGSVSTITHFFMSPDFFYYISKFVSTKVENSTRLKPKNTRESNKSVSTFAYQIKSFPSYDRSQQRIASMAFENQK
jgi:hypothetical protein